METIKKENYHFFQVGGSGFTKYCVRVYQWSGYVTVISLKCVFDCNIRNNLDLGAVELKSFNKFATSYQWQVM